MKGGKGGKGGNGGGIGWGERRGRKSDAGQASKPDRKVELR